MITKAKTYVESHYREEGLSLDDICEELGVSNSYFSSMFKKETGNSFVGYLTEYRMEKACKRLIETNEKSYMIAKSVRIYPTQIILVMYLKDNMEFLHRNIERSMQKVRNKIANYLERLKPGGIQSTIMVAFSIISVSIMLLDGNCNVYAFL